MGICNQDFMVDGIVCGFGTFQIAGVARETGKCCSGLRLSGHWTTNLKTVNGNSGNNLN